MVTQYGMSEKLGLRTFERDRRSAFLETPGMGTPRDYSEEKAKQIDEEVEQILRNAHTRTRQILKDKRQELEDVYQLLMQKEVVEGEELRQILEEEPQPERGKEIPDAMIA
jgi:cell division protease FtsH